MTQMTCAIRLLSLDYLRNLITFTQSYYEAPMSGVAVAIDFCCAQHNRTIESVYLSQSGWH